MREHVLDVSEDGITPATSPKTYKIEGHVILHHNQPEYDPGMAIQQSPILARSCTPNSAMFDG
jgi:hypothetical protein